MGEDSEFLMDLAADLVDYVVEAVAEAVAAGTGLWQSVVAVIMIRKGCFVTAVRAGCFKGDGDWDGFW